MNFASDNRGPAHPQVLEAMIAANEGFSPSYGSDDLTRQVCDQIREIFEAPDAAVFLTPSGTATNALILATLSNPWDEIYCAKESHIRFDECNAVEFYSGGARLTYVGENDRVDPDALRHTMENAAPHEHHNAQIGPTSITQVTDLGGVYTLDEIKAITEVAHEYGSLVHMDGARFTNAMTSLMCSPAEMTWKAGVDAVSFGGTKNGCLDVEAAIFFNPEFAWEFELRRKRAGHLFSKHRFLAAQMQGYLHKGLWIRLAQTANATGQKLFAGLQELGGQMMAPADANLGFVYLPRHMHAKAVAAGAVYEIEEDLENGSADEMLISRFVCDWSVGSEGVDEFLAIFED